MAYEIASRLKNPDLVRKVESVFGSFKKDPPIIRGVEILQGLNHEYQISANPAILYDLIQSGLLIKDTPAKNIEDYFFKVDFGKAASIFKREILAAEVIQEYERKQSAPNTLDVAFVATIPLKFNTHDFEFDEIYPTLIRIAAAAKHELWIVNPFFDEYGANYLLPSLIGAAKNETMIRILGRKICEGYEQEVIKPIKCIAAKFDEEGLSHRLEIRDFYQTDKNGIQIYALHTKMMIADEIFAYIGSANITKHSLRNNFEIGIILKGEKVKPLTEITRKIWAHATFINFDNLKEG
jgi:phosphatidylserine/phosphatidylglycerophosphate/cardiolipin synthase-like enzyme